MNTSIKHPIFSSLRRPLAYLIALLLFAPLLATGQQPTVTIKLECQQPMRPGEDVKPAVWHQFLADVDRFRECTHQAMERHQNAAAVHQRAARQAVDEWNLFVRHSLNAPADFPHESQPGTRSRSVSDNGVPETNGGLMGSDPLGELKPQFDPPPKLTIRRQAKPVE